VSGSSPAPAWRSASGPSPSGVPAVAQTLARVLADTSYVPIRRDELERRLQPLISRLADALFAEPFAVAGAEEAGAALVAEHLTTPEAGGRTVEILGARLLDDLGADSPYLRQRLAALLGAVTTGYARALRDRTLSEQESIHQAALAAQGRAERALQQSESQRQHDARHDPLTGLANRASFGAWLSDAFDSAPQGARVGVCLLDLDALKAVIDQFGHDTGDRLLVAVAERLGDYVGSHGHLLARLDGDEFGLLVVPSTSAEDLAALAARALDVIAGPIRVGGERLTVSASAGVVECPIAGTEPAELMRHAHLALSWAKADGGRRVAVFDRVRGARETERYALAADMPAALERGEFTIVYQPLVSMSDGRIRGVEALARWPHPRLGLVDPDRFVALAEENGLIVPLGRQVLRSACAKAATWASLAAEPPFVSVNLAVAQTHDERLVEDVEMALADTGLEPGRLQLEITESAMMSPDRQPLAKLQALAESGVGLAIDDFGTGWANLSYLRDLPVRDLKLDAAFSDGLRHPVTPNPADEKILTGLVSLGHALGLTVTAEGVETVRQARRLREIGCDLGQGWHFARPSTPEQLADLLTADAPLGDCAAR
jgi:diguanylate cyclase (GGDEF)-like protein